MSPRQAECSRHVRSRAPRAVRSVDGGMLSLIRASSGSRSLSAPCVVAQVLRQPVPPSRDRIPGAAARSLHCGGGGLGAARQPKCRREARVYVRPVAPADHAAAPLAAVAARVRRCARGRSGGLFTVPRCAPRLCSVHCSHRAVPRNVKRSAALLTHTARDCKLMQRAACLRALATTDG